MKLRTIAFATLALITMSGYAFAAQQPIDSAKVYDTTADIKCTSDQSCQATPNIAVNNFTSGSYTGYMQFTWKGSRGCLYNIRPTGTTSGEYCGQMQSAGEFKNLGVASTIYVLKAYTSAQMANFGQIMLSGWNANDVRGSGLFSYQPASQVYAAFTGVIAGDYLTVSSVTGTLRVGQFVNGAGIPSNTVYIRKVASQGAGIYRLNQTLTISAEAMTASLYPDNGYVVAPSDNAASCALGCMVRQKPASALTVWDFGASGDSVDVDATAAFNKLIAAVGRFGGGIAYAPAGQYGITSLSMSYDNVVLRGDGDGNASEWPTNSKTPATVLSHIGSAADTMISILPPVGATSRVASTGVSGVYLDGKGTAAIGLGIYDAIGGTFDNVGGTGFTDTGVEVSCLPYATRAITAPDPQHNNFISLNFDQSSGSGTFLRLAGVVDAGFSNGACDASLNSFGQIYGVYSAGIGIDFAASDNNTFNHVTLYKPSGAGTAIKYRASVDGVATAANANTIQFATIAGPIVAEGVSAGHSIASGPNTILGLDIQNGFTGATIGTGAVLFYGDNYAQPGYRFALHTTGAVRECLIDSAGYFEASGYLGVGATSTNTLNFATDSGSATCGGPTNGIITEALATPNNAAAAGYWIEALPTSLVIHNTGGVAAVFWWHVRGK